VGKSVVAYRFFSILFTNVQRILHHVFLGARSSEQFPLGSCGRIVDVEEVLMEPEKLANAYLLFFESKKEADRWAWNEVDDLVRRDPDRGWEITCLLVNKANSDEALGFVAAGPLEDLLRKHGPAVIDRIEAASHEDARLQIALSGVWIRPENPIFERWHALMWKYGFAEGKRAPL
jgi:hypothetical protein